MFAQVNEKSLYRVGQRVRSAYYPGVEFKVASKRHELNGALRLELKKVVDGTLIGGFRQKDVLPA